MRRLILSEFVTLDGVMEAPGSEEHRDGRNLWALRYNNDELNQYNRDLFFEAGAVLLGRVTYQIWAAYWPTAPDRDGFANRVNEIPKFVVSNTLQRADWENTSIISSDVGAAISALKDQPGGDIVLFGSGDLVNSLIPFGLIDQYRLLVYPVILGSGKHLFRDNIETNHVRLVSSRSFASGVVLLIYEPGEEPATAEALEQYAWTTEQIESLHAAQDTERVLATVMFTDIVNSTTRAAGMGDRQWRRLLDRHDRIAEAEVVRWHGRFVKSTGDGILATFDAPTRALRCAFALRAALASAGIDIRAAIHTGEIEVRANDIGGIGVHIASRALAEAGHHEVVVTRTVRDLATGTDLTFSPLGSVALRGVSGEWQLFTAAVD